MYINIWEYCPGRPRLPVGDLVVPAGSDGGGRRDSFFLPPPPFCAFTKFSVVASCHVILGLQLITICAIILFKRCARRTHAHIWSATCHFAPPGDVARARPLHEHIP